MKRILTLISSLIIRKCSLKLGPQCLEITKITVGFTELWPRVLNINLSKRGHSFQLKVNIQQE